MCVDTGQDKTTLGGALFDVDSYQEIATVLRLTGRKLLYNYLEASRETGIHSVHVLHALDGYYYARYVVLYANFTNGYDFGDQIGFMSMTFYPCYPSLQCNNNVTLILMHWPHKHYFIHVLNW